MLRETFGRYDTRFATTDMAIGAQHAAGSVSTLPDCNKDRPFDALMCLIKAASLVLRLRPHVVISTGAAPGFFCILWGRIAGAKTLWIDSIANAEKLSLSGKLAKHTAHQCLTQWEHLADGRKVAFRGAVL